METESDFKVERTGSLYLIHPLSDAADEHLRALVNAEASWINGAVVVERRYAQDLTEKLQEDGFTVQ